MADIVKKSENRPRWGLFEDNLDNMFEGFFRPLGRPLTEDNGSLMPAVDVVEENDRYLINAEIPGVDKDDIKVSVNEGILTINAERKLEEEKKDEKGRVICRESRYGNYVRSLRLNSAIDTDKINAKYNNGILALDLPKLEQAKPKQIKIDVH